MGNSRPIINWTEQWLTDSRQMVVVDGEVSSSKSFFLSCTILCSTAFCRLSNDSQRRITQGIDVDGAAYRLHGQKLAGIASGTMLVRLHQLQQLAIGSNSGMVRATNDPWSCAVTAPMARNLK